MEKERTPEEVMAGSGKFNGPSKTYQQLLAENPQQNGGLAQLAFAEQHGLQPFSEEFFSRWNHAIQYEYGSVAAYIQAVTEAVNRGG